MTSLEDLRVIELTGGIAAGYCPNQGNFLTPGLGQMEIVLAAFLILCFLALGILMPSRETHKKITPTAGMFFIVLASLVIAITAARLTYG